MVRTKPDMHIRWAAIIAMIAAVLISASPGVSGTAFAQAGEGESSAPAASVEFVGEVSISVEVTGAVTSRSLATDLEPVLLDMQHDLTTIVDGRPAERLLIRFVGPDELPDPQSWVAVAPDTWINADATVAIIDLDAWLALPAIESTNRLRHVVARRWIVGVSDAGMPPALLDGFARYLESPFLAEQARRASIVQQAYLDGELPTWSEMLDSTDTMGAFDEPAASRHIALAAFLVERYGASIISDLSARFSEQPDGELAEVVADATGQTADRLDESWEEFLAGWFAGGWRSNLFSALDLQPAEELFARGAYEAAVDRANQTLLLTTALDDRVGSAEAERVAAQGSVGVQAEALMTDAEEALRAHDYERALVLIDRADDQYALLPEDHRPASLIDTWRNLATGGAGAVEQLDAARDDAADWFQMRGARADAIEAGDTFASLGDTKRVDAAQRLVDDLDGRLFRLVLALGAAAVLLVTWLVVWSWNRAPGRIHWPESLPVEREAMP